VIEIDEQTGIFKFYKRKIEYLYQERVEILKALIDIKNHDSISEEQWTTLIEMLMK